ncbi:MAG: hypothetical protein ABIQ47_02285 [Tepidiformaceae bacterium]
MRAGERRPTTAVLLLALLPSLLFLGHWQLELAVPLLASHILLVPGEGAALESAHARHCHGGAATCSDVPYAGGSGFALLSEAVAQLTAPPTVVAVNEILGLFALHAPGPDPRPPQPKAQSLSNSLAG